MELGEDTITATRARERGRRRRLLLIVVAAVVAGVGIGLRLVDRWSAGAGPGDRGIPTAGLIFFGCFFAIGGLLFLIPSYWRWHADRSRWSGRTVFGKMPPRETLPGWRKALWDLQDWLIARDERRRDAMRRDPRPFQLRDVAISVSAGVTILLYAALR